MKLKKNNLDTEMKVVAIYCRVSTFMQGQGEFSSLDSQEKYLRSHCDIKGWEVYDVYSDTKTGANLEREQLNRLLDDADQGKFNLVICTKIDRLSRSIKDFHGLADRLAKIKIGLIAVSQNIDTSDNNPYANLMRNIFMSFAEFERNIISERTREKLYSQAKEGFWGGGHAALGYDVTDKKLVINENEAKLINKMFNYYLETPSSSLVAKRLNSEGFRTKTRTTKAGKTSGGFVFTKDNVKGIIKNKLYIGTIIFNDEEFTGLHKPIIDKSLFDKVQKQLEISRVDTKATLDPDSPLELLGVTKCGLCDRSLTTSSTFNSGRRYYYYKCSTAAHAGKSQCGAKDIPAEELETFAQMIVKHIASDNDFYNAVFYQMQDNSEQELDQLELKVNELKQNKTKISTKIHRMINAISNLPEVEKPDSILKEIRSLECQEAIICDEIEKNKDKITAISGNKFSEESLKSALNDFNLLYTKVPIKTRRDLNKLVFKEIRSFIKKGETEGEILFQIRGDGKISKTLKNIKKCIKDSDTNPFNENGGTEGSNTSKHQNTPETTKANSSMSEVRSFGALGSAGKARTYNPAVNSRMLCH